MILLIAKILLLLISFVFTISIGTDVKYGNSIPASIIVLVSIAWTGFITLQYLV